LDFVNPLKHPEEKISDRQNQQNMSKKYMASSKIITHMAGLKPKSQWYRISIRFMPNKKNQDY